MRVLLITFLILFCFPVSAKITGSTFVCESYRRDLLRSDDQEYHVDDVEFKSSVSYIAFNDDKTMMTEFVESIAYLTQYKVIYSNFETYTDKHATYLAIWPGTQFYRTARFDEDMTLTELQVDVLTDDRAIRLEYTCERSAKPVFESSF